MANNGTGLALAAGSLAGCPMALLPVAAVNLLEHMAAGWVRVLLNRACPLGGEHPPSDGDANALA